MKKYRKELEEDKSKKIIDKEEIINILSKGKNKQKIQSAQDYCSGKMVFAVQIEDEWYLLTTDRELIGFEEAESEGFMLEHKNVNTSNFSYQGIQAFLEEKDYLDIPELYESISSYLERFVYFSNEIYLH